MIKKKTTQDFAKRIVPPLPKRGSRFKALRIFIDLQIPRSILNHECVCYCNFKVDFLSNKQDNSK
jgi:hypothetical protein